MPQVADLKAKVSIDGAAQAKKDLSDLKGKAGSGSSGGGILGLADSFKAGLGAVSGFLAGFGAFSIATDAVGMVKDQLLDLLQAGMDEQKTMAQTAAVIKSTGGAAHISAQQVADLADQLAQMSGISNDTIEGSENLLLTFRAIGSQTFPIATKAILDMSVAMHEDLQSATIQVGKALQDPIHGVTTLQRVGVQLTDSQKALIKQFMDTGQSAKAQAVILDELNKEFGGSAEAAGKTLPGQLAILNEKWDEAKQKIGMAVIPILQQLLAQYVMPLADWLGKFLPTAIQSTTDFLNNQLIPAVQAVMASPFVTTIEGWAQSIATKLDPQLGDAGLAGHANTAKTAIKNLDSQSNTTSNNMATTHANRVQTYIDKADGLTRSLGGTPPKGGGSSTVGLDPAILKVNSDLGKMDAATNAAGQSAKQAQQPTEFLGGIFDGVGNAIHGAGDAIGGFVDSINQRLPGALPQIQRFGGFIRDVFQGALPGIQNTWDGFWGIVAFPVKFAFDQIKLVVTLFLDGLSGNFAKAETDTTKGLNQIMGDIEDFGASIGRLILGPFQTAIGAWGTAIGHFPDVLSPSLKHSFDITGQDALKDVQSIGALITGGWKGMLPGIELAIANMVPHIESAISDMMQKLQSFINDHMPHFPGITLPGIGGLPGRAGGGSVSGDFVGAERGMELLVTPGVYNAPPGSYVYNNQQTKQLLNGGGRGGNTYVTNVYPQQANIDTQQLARIQRRQELLTGMRG